MPEISVIGFVEDDLPFGKSLTDQEGWDRTAAIWKRMLRVEPKGFFKATYNGKNAGIGAVLRYGDVVWINSIIVSEQYRNKGVGSALMRECLSCASDGGAESIRLDCIAGVEPFYAKFGFTEEHLSLRFTRIGEECFVVADKITERDFAEVVAFDRAHTGMDRGRVLESIFRDNPRLSFIVRDSEGIRGYLLSSPCEERVDLGPCVCRRKDDRCASILVQSAMGIDPRKEYRICVSGLNLAAAGLMRNMGFKESMPATRMALGKKVADPESAYAMISPAEG